MRKEPGLQTGVLVDFEGIIKRLHALAAETLDEVVLQGQEEYRHTDIPLTSRTAAELVIDSAGFVAFRTDDAKAARRNHLFLLFVRLRLIMLVQLLISLADLFRLFVDVLNIHAGRELYRIVFHALFAEAFLREIFGIAAQQNIRSAPRHVRRNRHRSETARLRHDFRFAFVVFRIQNVVLHAVPLQKTRNFLRLIHRRGTHQNRLAALVALHDFVDDRPFLPVYRRIHHVGKVDSLNWLIRGNLDDVQRINRAELRFLRLRRTRHARKFRIQTEIVLERNRRIGLILAPDLHAFLRLDRLMKPVGISAPDHESTRKFVYDDDLSVVDDIIFVALEQLMRLQRLLNVMVQIRMLDFRDTLDTEKFLCLPRAAVRQLYRLILAVDDIVPILRRRKRFLALRRVRRGRRALLFLLRFVVRLLREGHFGEIDRLFLVVLGFRRF